MKLNPTQVAGQLARGLAPVYVVGGDEPLLIQESLDAIRAKARKEGYSEREVLDADKSFEWQRLIEACNAMSLFATRRIVELNLPSGSPGTEGADVLKQLAARPAPDTLLLVICGALDYKQRSGAWYAALESAGASVYAEPISQAEFPRWIEQRMRQAGLNADAEAVQDLAERTEGNALAAAQDIVKLALLHPEGRIGLEQIQQAVADSARFDTFDLLDRMLSGDADGVQRSLARLKEEGVDVLEIMGGLLWGLREWTRAQAAFAETGDAASAAGRSRLRRPQQARLIKALPRTRVPQLYGWLRKCQQIDLLTKSTGGKDQAWEELLTLVLAASGAAPRTPRAA